MSSAFVDVTVSSAVVVWRDERRGVVDSGGGEGCSASSPTACSSVSSPLLLLTKSPNKSSFVTLRAGERLLVGVGDFRDG